MKMGYFLDVNFHIWTILESKSFENVCFPLNGLLNMVVTSSSKLYFVIYY